MMALLRHAKAGSYFGDTRDLLSRLIRICLQTGLLTSILALIVPPLFLSNTFSFFALPWYILGKSEVISLLANLNARKRLGWSVVHDGDGKQAAPVATKLSTVVFAPANRRTEGENIDSIDISAPIHSLV